MVEKELRKLSRLQLLELLVIQAEENENLKKQLEELKNKRIEETIQISNLGSIAEASVQISGVLNAAQEAADLYMEESKKKADSVLKEAYEKAEEIMASAKK